MSSSDFGIIISAPGADALTGKGNQITLNTANPFIKIDTQNPKGFQTITMIIINDPPKPVSPAVFAFTVLYKFKHNYTYIPILETLFYLESPPAGISGYQLYSQDSISLGGTTAGNGTTLYAVADDTNVYIVCERYSFDGSSSGILTGTNLLITTHVFVDGVTDV